MGAPFVFFSDHLGVLARGLVGGTLKVTQTGPSLLMASIRILESCSQVVQGYMGQSRPQPKLHRIECFQRLEASSYTNFRTWNGRASFLHAVQECVGSGFLV